MTQKRERNDSKPRTFFKLLKWVCRSKNISSNAKIIYSIVGSLIDKDRGYAYPSIAYLCTESGLTHRQVTYAIEELVTKKYIKTVRNIGRRSHFYLLSPVKNQPTPNTNVGGDPSHQCGGTPNTNVGGPLTNLSGVTLIYNNREQIEERIEGSKTPHNFVMSIFDHWKNLSGEYSAIIDQDRIKTIEKALERYAPEKLKLAIKGCLENEWYRSSGNDRIGYILRNSDNIEKFMKMANSASNPESDISVRAKRELSDIFAKRDVSEAALNAYRLSCAEFGNSHEFRYCNDEKKALRVFTRYYSQEVNKNNVQKRN